MIPDYLVYDELKRRQDGSAWQPAPLDLPLYSPEILDVPSSQEGESEADSERGVVIIDMNDGWDLDE